MLRIYLNIKFKVNKKNMDYNGGDAFNQLRQKVGELRQRKDHLQSELSRD